MADNLKFRGAAAPDFRSMLACCPPETLDSPAGPMIPHLAYWASPRERLAGICEMLEMIVPRTYDAAFEHGIGNGDRGGFHTDLLVSWPGTCIACESAYLRERSPTLMTLFQTGKVENRELQPLFTLLENAGFEGMTSETLGELELETLLLAASACSVKAERCFLFYECFYRQLPMAFSLQKQLSILASKRAPGCTVRFVLADIMLVSRPGWDLLMKRWSNGDRSLRQEISRGIVEGSLMDFAPPKFTVI
jgi:hypothetical protein